MRSIPISVGLAVSFLLALLFCAGFTAQAQLVL